MSASADVIFVDLDGTLIATDLLWEAIVQSVKLDPGVLLQMPVWLIRGRAGFKQAIAERLQFDAHYLPYRQEVLEFLAERRAAGNRIILATAANDRLASQVAREIGIFDGVLASDGEKNLRGQAKADAIQAYCRAHGFDQFAYIGDAQSDLEIWKNAAEVYVVDPGRSLLAAIRQIREPTAVFLSGGSRLSAMLHALRPQQWLKNTLLFVPLLLSHAFTDVARVALCIVAFVLFSLCASSLYIVNDLFDMPADRAHPRKRRRPFASGQLSVSDGVLLSAVLLGISVSMAAILLPFLCFVLLLVYIVTAVLYSWWLKRKVLVDVLVLAGLYTLRVLAGGAVAGVAVSEWLLAFSIFLFTSLAFAKRYAELLRVSDEGQSGVNGRGYRACDINIIGSMGPCCGMLAVLVFALYINSDKVSRLYVNPQLLWLICPLLLYWIGRIWFLASRRFLSEDPVVFALRDRTSLLIGAATIVLVILAGSPGLHMISS